MIPPSEGSLECDTKDDYRQEIKPVLMIVDDDDGPRKAIEIVFKSGYELLVARDGEEALDLTKQHSIDVVVLDICMKGMNGIEVLGELKRNDPDIEVVILTGNGELETAKQAIRLGAFDYVSKPFDLIYMRETVRSALDKRRRNLQIHAERQRLEELNAQLHMERLRQEVLEGKREIYGSLFTDINSPLSFISCWVQILSESLKHSSRIEGKELSRIQDNLTQINSQINRCFDNYQRYSEFYHGRNDSETKVSVNKLIRDLEDFIRLHRGVYDQRVIVEPLERDLTVKGKGMDLLQILLNLTENSLHTPTNPRRLRVTAGPMQEMPELDEGGEDPQDLLINRKFFESTNEVVQITIDDAGDGIPKGRLSELLNFRAVPDSAKSLDVGLEIARYLVVESHTALWVHNVSGEGISFTLYMASA